jgi:ABC-type iron transport system FetAB ATPase subunit
VIAESDILIRATTVHWSRLAIGSSTAITGRSGSGKGFFLRMIATLILTTRSLAEFQARPERESEGQAAWSQLRNTVHGEPKKKCLQAIIQAMKEKREKAVAPQ